MEYRFHLLISFVRGSLCRPSRVCEEGFPIKVLIRTVLDGSVTMLSVIICSQMDHEADMIVIT